MLEVCRGPFDEESVSLAELAVDLDDRPIPHAGEKSGQLSESLQQHRQTVEDKRAWPVVAREVARLGSTTR